MPGLRAFLRVNTGYESEQESAELKASGAPGLQATDKDDYLTKIIKYIPGEIVAAYLFAAGTIGDFITEGEIPEGELSNPVKLNLYWWAFIVLLVLAPIYRYLAIKLPGIAIDRLAIVQAVIATIAFATWVYALGGPFDPYENSSWHPTKGALVLLGVTLALPLLERVALLFKPSSN